MRFSAARIPSDIELRFPELWEKSEDDENSRNRYERQFLDKLLERRKVILKPEPKYIKILDAEFGRSVESTINSYTQSKLTSIVVNFVDMLAHGRSDSSLLKEIAPDESAYRSLTRSWFLHSSLFGMLQDALPEPERHDRTHDRSREHPEPPRVRRCSGDGKPRRTSATSTAGT